MVQLEREHIQSTMWNKFLLKARGELKGTMWDPEDSHPIPYSEFSRLLDEERVNYLEYAEFGKDVAGVYRFLEPIAHGFKGTWSSLFHSSKFRVN